MRALIFARLRQLVFVLLGMATLVFFLTRLSGDPALAIAGPDAPPEQIAAIRTRLGLDKPLLVQFLDFLGDLFTLNFGDSLQFRQPAMGIVLDRLPLSLLLAGFSIVISIVVSIPVGIYIASHRRTALSRIISATAMVLQSAPNFVIGLVLILVFAVSLRWLPSFGAEGFTSMILPAFTLSAFMTARQVQLVQAYATDELTKGYVRTARSLGYSDWRVRFRHILRNVLVPLVSLLGLEFGLFIGGAVVTEAVFAWPGIGGLMVTAVTARDYPLIQAAVFIVGICVVAVNFLVDVLYQVIDPRMKAKATA